MLVRWVVTGGGTHEALQCIAVTVLVGKKLCIAMLHCAILLHLSVVTVLVEKLAAIMQVHATTCRMPSWCKGPCSAPGLKLNYLKEEERRS